MLARILIDEAGLAFGDAGEGRPVAGAGIEHAPFGQATLRQLFEMGVAARPDHVAGIARAEDRDRRIDDGVDPGPNALDRLRIEFPVVALAPGRHIVDMQMHDRRTRLHGRDAIRDDIGNADGNAGLALLAPGTVDRGLDPDRLGHAGMSFGQLSRIQRVSPSSSTSPAASARIAAAASACDGAKATPLRRRNVIIARKATRLLPSMKG